METKLNDALDELLQNGHLDDGAAFHLTAGDDVLYEQYIYFYDGVRSFYQQLWSNMAVEEYGKPFEQLSPHVQQQIKQMRPLKITELF